MRRIMRRGKYRMRARALPAAVALAISAGLLIASPSSAATAPVAFFNPEWGRNVGSLEAGATVVAFSSQFSTSFTPQEMLDSEIDDNPWATGLGQLTGQFVTVGLVGLSAWQIDRVRVMPRIVAPDQRVRDFEIDVSLDNITYTTVLSATAEDNASLQEFTFPSVSASYVRFRPLNNRGSTCCISTQLLEVLTGPAGGRNVALLEAGSTVVARSSQVFDHTVEKMLNYPTYTGLATEDPRPWATTTLTNQFTKFELAGGGSYVIDRVRIQPRADSSFNQRVRDFAIDVSNTGFADADFTNVLLSTAADNRGLQEFVFPPVAARYVRYRPLNNRGGCCNISTHQLKVMTGQQSGGVTVTFRNLSSDADGDISSYLWTFGDGSLPSTEVNPTHTFPGPGDYTVSLTVTDALGNQNTYSLVQRVLQPPTGTITVDPPVPNEGQSTSFVVSAQDPDGDGLISRSEWAWGDGTAATKNLTGFTATHAFPDNGDFNVAARIVDVAEQSANVTAVVSPLNVPPAVNVGADRAWVSDLRLTFSTSVTDVSGDPSTSRSCNWDYGDGGPLVSVGPPCGSLSFDRTFSVPVGDPPRTFTATLSATDKDGDTGSDSVDVSVYPQMFLDLASVNKPWGADWNPLVGKLVVARDVSSSFATLGLLDASGVATGPITGNLVKGTSEAPKLAASPGLGGFRQGDVFLGNGVSGQIARVQIQADGTVSAIDNPWVSIPGLASGTRLRGIAFDDHGSFGFGFVTVWNDGRIFVTASDGSTSLVESLGRVLEGADVAGDGLGPASGCILTTDVASKNVWAVCPRLITFAIRTAPGIATLAGAAAELSAVTYIASAGDMFISDVDQSRIYKGDSRSFTAALAQHVLVSTRTGGQIWELSYNETTGLFESRLFTPMLRPFVGGAVRIEQMAFVSGLSGSLDPATATVPVLSPHTVRAVFRTASGDPVPGLEVNFNVTGANAASGTATTNALGVAVFTYSGSNTGVDTIVATSLAATTNPVNVTWVRRASILEARPVLAMLRYPGGPSSSYPQLSARLADSDSGAGVPGRTLHFYVTELFTSNTVLYCSASTGFDGVASCSGSEMADFSKGFEAVFLGDATYTPSESRASLVGINVEE